MGKRVIVIVLDSVGIGGAPDAKEYGDLGADTFNHVAAGYQGFAAPNLARLGFGHIDGVTALPRKGVPQAAVAALLERSAGKDTTTGHWEMMGAVLTTPWPVYPDGFPREVLDPFEKAVGKSVLANKPSSGTVILDEFGPEHMATGRPIVYTSADSVFQIAAHEEIVPIEKLYEWCKIARGILDGPHRVGRVIARPFLGGPGAFKRTPRRHDYAVSPPRNALDLLCERGVLTSGVGKIYDIYNGQGVRQTVSTVSNADGIARTLEAMDTMESGLLFVNLVDFDMQYGHRNDVAGYAKAIMEFDAALPSIERKLRPDDLLMISADHGCDPAFPGTDHTRERVPLLVAGAKVKPGNLGTLAGGFGCIGRLAVAWLVDPAAAEGIPGDDLLGKVLAR